MAKTIGRRGVLTGIGLGALSACAPLQYPPRGGQLAGDERSQSDRPSEGGVGGTGIVGLLYSANDLSVNGLRLEAAGDLAVEALLGPRRIEDLAFGHALTVEAAAASGGRLLARSIAVTYPLIGSVEALTDTGFRCLGVEVTVEAGAPLVDGAGRALSLAPGQRVAVSGLWRGDGVVASRVELLGPATPLDVAAGTVKAAGEAGGLRVGGVALTIPESMTPPPLGGFATVIGRRVGARLVAGRLEVGRFRGRAGPLQRLSIEGYLEPVEAAPGYTVSGLGHSFDPDAKLAALAGERTLFVGRYDGSFVVQHGLPLPGDLRARRTLLAGLADGFAPPDAQSTR